MLSHAATSSTDAWFVAQLKPNCAHIAERNLRRQGFLTFLPLESKTRRERNRFVTTLTPLFPGYIFVAIDTVRGLWRAVNSTLGITRLVSFGRMPTPVPTELVEQLQRRCDASGQLLPPDALQPGDCVRVTSGPFADFIGTIEKIAPDRRVWVLMELMGAQTRVAVQADVVRRHP